MVAGQAHQRAMSINGYLLAGQEVLFQPLQSDAHCGVLQVRLVLCYPIKGLLVTFHQRPDCVLLRIIKSAHQNIVRGLI